MKIKYLKKNRILSKKQFFQYLIFLVLKKPYTFDRTMEFIY